MDDRQIRALAGLSEATKELKAAAAKFKEAFDLAVIRRISPTVIAATCGKNRMSVYRRIKEINGGKL